MNNKLKCILIIDDDEPTNFFTNIILEDADCTDQIRIVQSGREALDYLAKSESSDVDPDFPSPDLIFLDINMPAMDGWEFLEEYQKLPAPFLEKCTVIMLSSSIDRHDIEIAKTYRVVRQFISIPLTPDMLETLLTA